MRHHRGDGPALFAALLAVLLLSHCRHPGAASSEIKPRARALAQADVSAALASDDSLASTEEATTDSDVGRRFARARALAQADVSAELAADDSLASTEEATDSDADEVTDDDGSDLGRRLASLARARRLSQASVNSAELSDIALTELGDVSTDDSGIGDGSDLTPGDRKRRVRRLAQGSAELSNIALTNSGDASDDDTYGDVGSDYTPAGRRARRLSQLSLTMPDESEESDMAEETMTNEDDSMADEAEDNGKRRRQSTPLVPDAASAGASDDASRRQLPGGGAVPMAGILASQSMAANNAHGGRRLKLAAEAGGDGTKTA